jgi:hypothetical protein
MFRKSMWLFAVAVVVTSIPILGAPARSGTAVGETLRGLQAGAVYGCNPGRRNNYLHYYWDGADRNTGGTAAGVYASISNYAPRVSPPSNNDVSEWVMLDQRPSSDLYIQIGWIDFSGGRRYTFDEYSFGPNTFHDNYYPAYPVNSMPRYTVVYQPGHNHRFLTEVNGRTYDVITKLFAPNDAQIFAEIHTRSSQIPGGSRDRGRSANWVRDAHILRLSKGWRNFNGATFTTGGSNGAGPSWMGEAPARSFGVNSWRTWDNACRH